MVGIKTIEPPDSFHVNAAMGWLGLGDHAEAAQELAQITVELKEHPVVLELRWQIEAKAGRWKECLEAATELLAMLPDNPSGYIAKAYAMRRIEGGSLAAAREALEPALGKFPAEPIIPYNLACYACQMGLMDEARTLLKKAFALDGSPRLKEMALSDEDLQELWAEIRKL